MVAQAERLWLEVIVENTAAVRLYEETFGMPLVHRETVSQQGVEAAAKAAPDKYVYGSFGNGTVSNFAAERQRSLEDRLGRSRVAFADAKTSQIGKRHCLLRARSRLARKHGVG